MSAADDSSGHLHGSLDQSENPVDQATSSEFVTNQHQVLKPRSVSSRKHGVLPSEQEAHTKLGAFPMVPELPCGDVELDSRLHVQEEKEARRNQESNGNSCIQLPLSRRRSMSEGSTPNESIGALLHVNRCITERLHKKQLLNIAFERNEFRELYESERQKCEESERRCKEFEEQAIELRRVVHNLNKHTASDGKLGEGLGTRLDKGVQTTHDERVSLTSGSTGDGVPTQVQDNDAPSAFVVSLTSGSTGGSVPTPAQDTSKLVCFRVGHQLQGKEPVEDTHNVEVPSATDNPHNKQPPPFPTLSSHQHHSVEPAATFREPENQQPESEIEDVSLTSGSTGGYIPTQVQENNALYEVVNIFSRKVSLTSGSTGDHILATQAQDNDASSVHAFPGKGHQLQGKEPVEDTCNVEVPSSTDNPHSKQPSPFPTLPSNQHHPVEPASTFPEPENQEPESEREDAEEDYISTLLDSPVKGKKKHARCTVCFEKKTLANSHIVSRTLLITLCGGRQCIMVWEHQDPSPTFKHPTNLSDYLECPECDRSTSDLEGICKDNLASKPDVQSEANILHVLIIASRFLLHVFTKNALKELVPKCNRRYLETFLEKVRSIRLRLLQLRQSKVPIRECLQRLSEDIPKDRVLTHVYTKKSKYRIVLTLYNAPILGSSILIYFRVDDCCWGVPLGTHTVEEMQPHFSKVVDDIEQHIPEQQMDLAMIHKGCLHGKLTQDCTLKSL